MFDVVGLIMGEFGNGMILGCWVVGLFNSGCGWAVGCGPFSLGAVGSEEAGEELEDCVREMRGDT